MPEEYTLTMPELTDEQVWLMNLSYEIRTMAELPTYIERCHQSGPTLVAAACLEATLLHARALIEFVAGRPRRDNRRGRSSRDFDPTCFLPGWQLLEPERFDTYLGLIDAHLAHLSKRRGGGDGVMGPGFVTTLVDEILVALGKFESALAGTEHYTSVHVALESARRSRQEGPLSHPPGR
jgi:hypothetical protein